MDIILVGNSWKQLTIMKTHFFFPGPPRRAITRKKITDQTPGMCGSSNVSSFWNNFCPIRGQPMSNHFHLFNCTFPQDRNWRKHKFEHLFAKNETIHILYNPEHVYICLEAVCDYLILIYLHICACVCIYICVYVYTWLITFIHTSGL